MSPLPPELRSLLNRAVVSLATWHVLEGMAAQPGRAPMALASLMAVTGLDVTQARRAIASLRRHGLVHWTPEGELALAPRHAPTVERLVEAVAADRTLLIAVIKEAARRECATGPLHHTVPRAGISARLGPP